MKKVLITGASYGLGQTLSKMLIDKDFLVYGISRSKPSKELTESKNFIWLRADISKLSELNIIFQKIKSIDILVNNVGVYSKSLFENESLEMIDKLIDINLKGNIFVTKLSIKKMNKNSRIVFINSVAGLNYIDKESIYVTTKHGLAAFANVLGKELRSKKIKVTSIYPGGINTPLQYGNPNQNKLLSPKFVSKYILQIIEESSVEFKNLTLYPEIENH